MKFEKAKRPTMHATDALRATNRSASPKFFLLPNRGGDPLARG